ncbi:MAG: sugar ABC transporter substrate-binding protein, partial [Verrucomicrobia bacterium]|nr:sugar ABC transporter substrate-binding protein [Verrucomicrobiota bacterium]
KLMKGEQIDKVITLPTKTIDKSNADQILKENGLA